MSGRSTGTVLLTGASGFVGGRLHPLLVKQGWTVRCLTRDASRSREAFPDRDWVEGDVRDAGALARALQGCQAACYLVHEMGAAHDFAE
ncbi:MAG: NAD-dependent epimerase/dehydratase family protein, partial [Thermoanaerobaculia bacterium]